MGDLHTLVVASTHKVYVDLSLLSMVVCADFYIFNCYSYIHQIPYVSFKVMIRDCYTHSILLWIICGLWGNTRGILLRLVLSFKNGVGN